jgi:ribosomal protein S18 acetylase RimI-like enzyme
MPRPSLDIRVAGPADAAALTAFAARTFRETYLATCQPADIEVYVAEHFAPERQAAELADPTLRTLLTFVDRTLAGYVQIRDGRAPASVPGDRPIEIARFYVDAPWHGRGIAAAQMAAALDVARGGGDVAWLGVYQSNARAVKFYEKSGFRVVGTSTFTMGTDVQDDYVMARDVG